MQGTLLTVQVVLTLFHCLGMTSAFFRLYRRKKTGKVDWDDYAAALALALNLMYFPSLWFPDDDVFDPNPAKYHNEATIKIIDSWLSNIVWPLLLWTTRISLGLSVTRVLPGKTRFFYASWALVLVLVAGAIVVIVISAVQCGIAYQSWSTVAPYQCYAGYSYYIAFTSLDVISDLLLVAVPLWIFWKDGKLTSTNRLVIKFGFAANGVTAAASLIAGVILIAHYSDMAMRASTHVLCVVSLLACNSLVVVTSIYRRFRSKQIVKPPMLPIALPSRQPTENVSSLRPATTTTNAGTEATSAGPSSSAYTDDYSGPSTSGAEESLHLTMTVVYTDPAFTFPSEEHSQAAQSHLSRKLNAV